MAKKLTVKDGFISSATKIFLFPEKIATEPILQKEAERFWLTDNKKEEIKNLFYSLKQKQLKLPGIVPIIQIVPYFFDTTKIVIATQKAVYFLDRQKLSLEVLALVPAQALTVNDSEIVFLTDKTISKFTGWQPAKLLRKSL